MRQGNHNKQRMRGRSRKGANPATRTIESNGPDVKVRGNAQHIAEKYHQLARDAQGSGDRIMAENYLQHAEHYNRIVAAANASQPYGHARMQSTQPDISDGGEMEHLSDSSEIPLEDEPDQVEAEVTRYSQSKIDTDMPGDSIGESRQNRMYDISDDPTGPKEKVYRSQHRSPTPRSRVPRRSPAPRGRGTGRTPRTSANG